MGLGIRADGRAIRGRICRIHVDSWTSGGEQLRRMVDRSVGWGFRMRGRVGVWMAVIAASGLGIAPNRIAAQAVTGSVTHDVSSRPVPNVVVRLLGSDGEVGTTQTDMRGRYRLEVPRDGTYSVQISSLGFSTVTSEPMTLSASSMNSWNGSLSSAPVELSRLQVIAEAHEGQFIRRRRMSRTLFQAGPVSDEDGLRRIREVLDHVPEVFLSPSGVLRMRDRSAQQPGPCMRMLFNEFSPRNDRNPLRRGRRGGPPIEMPSGGTVVIYPRYGLVPEELRAYAYSDDVTQDPTRPRGVDTTPCGLVVVWEHSNQP